MNIWHDLIDNPNNTPDTTRNVLFAFYLNDEHKEDEEPYLYYAVGIYGVGNKWYPNYLDDEFDMTVVAWKDIDKFVW